jgi:hypothetical protein
LSLPSADLDDKTFDELIKEAISRIPAYAPEWTDYNVHDPGITFIELFAWLAEMQIYRLNRISDRNYRKFLKLMGIPSLKTARPAEADLTFSSDSAKTVPVPKGTKVAAMNPVSGEDIVFETKRNLNVVDSELRAILSRSKNDELSVDNLGANENENIYYYAFRHKPEAGDGLYLGFSKSLTGTGVTLAFYLYEGNIPGTGKDDMEKPEVYPSATLKWEYYADGDDGDWEGDAGWEGVEEVKEDETRHLALSGKVLIKIEEGMGLHNGLYWLRCIVEEAGYETPPKIDFVLLNTISAIQSNTFNNCNFSSSGLPGVYFDLQHPPVMVNTLRVKGEEGEGMWSEVEDFDASKPGDMHYTVDSDAGRVRFGDGINGKIPLEGKANITISYSSGGGVRGNVEPHAINRVLNKLDGAVTVENKKAASGGEKAETLEEAKIRARKELKTVYRAVTSKDYENLAMKTSGLKVSRAKAIPGYHPDQKSEFPGIVTVIVVPESQYDEPEPSAGFLKTVYRYLDKHRLLTTEVFVMPPEYVGVSVTATVHIKPKSDPDRVKGNVEKELKNFLHPINGGVDRKGWLFGRPVYRSEVYEIIDGVEGVDYVIGLTLKREGTDQSCDIPIPPNSLVFHSIKFPSDITIETGASHG